MINQRPTTKVDWVDRQAAFIGLTNHLLYHEPGELKHPRSVPLLLLSSRRSDRHDTQLETVSGSFDVDRQSMYDQHLHQSSLCAVSVTASITSREHHALLYVTQEGLAKGSTTHIEHGFPRSRRTCYTSSAEVEF